MTLKRMNGFSIAQAPPGALPAKPKSSLVNRELSHFSLCGGHRIREFLLLLKILSIRRPCRLALTPLQVTFSILVHCGASIR